MSNIVGDSSNPQVAAISGKHTTQGIGVEAESAEKWAIRANAPRDTAIFATSDVGRGIDARSRTHSGVEGFSEQGTGIYAKSVTGIGLYAESAEKWAIRANAPRDTAIHATSDTGMGIDARSRTNTGVDAFSEQGIAVRANAPSNTAIFATSGSGKGIDVRSTSGIGIYAEGKVAGHFQGNVVVTGDIQLPNADCAEEFDVLAPTEIEPGMLMVIGSEGKLCQSMKAYDKRVAGIVSGAGNLKPGMVLGKVAEEGKRLPIALMGKVYCKVDADFGSIEVGDLLTTSNTPGHAMKASDPVKAFGAVIGKALEKLEAGRGLIPVLVTLQ
jgi:hypothetical protein